MAVEGGDRGQEPTLCFNRLFQFQTRFKALLSLFPLLCCLLLLLVGYHDADLPIEPSLWFTSKEDIRFKGRRLVPYSILEADSTLSFQKAYQLRGRGFKTIVTHIVICSTPEVLVSHHKKQMT